MTSAPVLARNKSSISDDEIRRDYEYAPIPDNYIKILRERLKLSQQKLADQIQCSKLVILKTEQGNYPNIPPVVMDYWVGRGESELRLADTYSEYQAAVRYHYSYLFGSVLLVVSSHPGHPSGSDEVEHPLKQLMSHMAYNLSINEVSKRMCVAQSTMQYFLKKWRSQQTVPVGFCEALLGMGYSQTQVSHFCRVYEQWRELHK